MVSLVLGCASVFARGVDTSQQYQVPVDYTQSLMTALQSGSYNWVEQHVSSADFPDATADGTATLSAKLAAFDTSMSIDDFTKAQAAAGFRQATLKELLAFGKAFPNVQKDAPIIALGSTAMEPVMATNAGPSNGTTRIEAALYPVLDHGLMGGRTVNVSWPRDNEATPTHTYGSYYALVIAQQK
jgi:hypothetical protein